MVRTQNQKSADQFRIFRRPVQMPGDKEVDRLATRLFRMDGERRQPAKDISAGACHAGRA